MRAGARRRTHGPGRNRKGRCAGDAVAAHQELPKDTGDKLLLNRTISSPGHYQAYDVGVPSIAEKGKYGPDVEAEVMGLLIDLHTGQLGIPAPGRIYWESGTTIDGDRFWMAKRR